MATGKQTEKAEAAGRKKKEPEGRNQTTPPAPFKGKNAGAAVKTLYGGNQRAGHG